LRRLFLRFFAADTVFFRSAGGLRAGTEWLYALQRIFIIAILSRVYVQLNARLIKEELWEDRFLREDRMFVEEFRT